MRIDAKPKNATTVIKSKVLIPGRGDPIRDGTVVFEKATIAWVGDSWNLPKEYCSILPINVEVLMPGLWDCHVHFLGVDMDKTNMEDSMQTYLPGFSTRAGILAADDLKATLSAGYTSIRELGGFGADIWPAVQAGHIKGPNIYAAVALLSITGGHGDDQNAPVSTVREHMRSGAPVAVCDGIDGCVKAVRDVVRRGARVVKVASSGGVLSPNDDPEDQQFSDEELRAIVGEATRSRRAVAAHAIGKSGIMAALNAGVTTIEHGTFLDDEAADLMVARGAILVPTRHVDRVIEDNYIDKLPAPSRRKFLDLLPESIRSYKLALDKGVKIAMGTDIMSSGRSSKLSHGTNGHELEYAVEMGMSPLAAIEAATANGPETLGRMAPLSGQLREGYDADVIAVASNPLDDISVLADPLKITHVWKAGEIVKCPLGD